jgi:hypothetical protein
MGKTGLSSISPFIYLYHSVLDLSFRLFEGDKQGMIEIELKNTQITTNDLGDVFEFDTDILPSELNTKAILTNITEDIKQGSCKCKFFLLGD